MVLPARSSPAVNAAAPPPIRAEVREQPAMRAGCGCGREAALTAVTLATIHVQAGEPVGVTLAEKAIDGWRRWDRYVLASGSDRWARPSRPVADPPTSNSPSGPRPSGGGRGAGCYTQSRVRLTALRHWA